ncbi:MAG: DUF6441 family protein [Thermosynechococcaceae cyanobacterium MS004]|nr:DUF6441 family protein [Thermosynechococcaceae cyanobacterium MS004]
MVELRLADQRRAAREFFRAEVRNLDAATKATTRTTARALRRETAKELRRFRRGKQSTGAFQKAVKVYDVDPRGQLGPASFVRLGVPFMHVFQEGSVIRGKPRLAILLPTGEALGFRRITPGNTWKQASEKMQARSDDRQVRIIPISKGRTMVAILRQGQWVPIYLFQQQVKEPKKLSFFEMAEALADEMPRLIEALMRNDYAS